MSDKRRHGSDIKNKVVSFDLQLNDRFDCHFLKSKAYSDLKAHPRNKSFGGAEFSYETSLETDMLL